jgi:hypothetical protein
MTAPERTAAQALYAALATMPCTCRREAPYSGAAVPQMRGHAGVGEAGAGGGRVSTGIKPRRGRPPLLVNGLTLQQIATASGVPLSVIQDRWYRGARGMALLMRQRRSATAKPPSAARAKRLRTLAAALVRRA